MPRPKPPRIALLVLLPATVLFQLVAARHPEAVERAFTQGVYRHVSSRLACLTAPLPFSLAEALLAVLAALAAWRLRRGVRLSPACLRRVLEWGGVAYALFLLLWGLNYARRPLAASLGVEVRAASTAELADLARGLAAALGPLRRGLPEDEGGVLRLGDGRRGALSRVAAGFERAAALHPVLDGSCARPKAAWLSPVLSRLGITGIYVPFTGEPHVNVDAPDPEIPFAAAHELTHQRGIAREDEANFAGYLACRLHPDRDVRYSGVLAATLYTLGALEAVDRATAAQLARALEPGVRRDVDAIQRWAARHAGPVRDAAERINDAYLRSQGQAEGTRSYGRMVDLLLAERRAGQGPDAP